MVRAADVKGGFLDLAETRLVSKEDFLDFTRNHKPQQGDIVLSRVGSYFNFSFNKSGKEFCIGQNTSIIVPEIESRFLYYSLISPFVQDQVERSLVGTSQRTLSLKYIRELKIPVPPIPEQRAIAGILGALDDKIEVNRLMNATLESMARAVFRQWFVENEEVGGWDIGQVKDLGEVITGKTPPTNDRENYDGEIPFITIPDMHGKLFVIETGKTLSGQGVQTQRNKTLPPFSICISCIATPGLVSMTTKPSQTNQQINSLK